MKSLKDYLLAILAFGFAIMAALFYRSKAKYEKAMRKGQEQVIETERKAHKAIADGRKRVKEARQNAKTAIIKRRYFK